MLNNDFLLLFVLAHLIGDYVLQTNKIAKMKSEGLKGVALHTLIVGSVQIALLSCYGIRGIVAGVVGTIIHYGIDCLKFMLGKQFRNMELLLYLIDQGLHFLVLILLTLIFAPDTGWVEKYAVYIRILTALALLLSTASVTAKTVARGLLANIRKQSFFLGNERWTDTLTVGILALAAVMLLNRLPIVAFLPMSIIGAYVYVVIQKKAYRYGWQASLLKYMTLIVFAVLAFWISDFPW